MFEGDNEEPEMNGQALWDNEDERPLCKCLRLISPKNDSSVFGQVGPVIDPSNPKGYEGQYISAGYTGHGMPRAYAW